MTVLGADALLRKLADIPRRERKAIKDALLVSANEQSNYWVVRIQKNSGTGRKYKRGKRTHAASSPGEYPNADMGELVGKRFVEGRGELAVAWGTSAKHALPLEVGTSKMAARPHMRPTFNALRARASARVLAAVNEALRAARG